MTHFAKTIQHVDCSKHDKHFVDATGILHKNVFDFNSKFSAIFISQILIKYLLHVSHNSLGHVRATTLYHILKSSITFKAWEEKNINVSGHATNVKLLIYKKHTLSAYTKILHKLHKTTYPFIL